ncbi:MAG: hypothetical protein KJZ92_10900 [Rhodocyclaceae bacterium]|nr:hypothetical protein [Rhodocyclaceae bacterium]
MTVTFAAGNLALWGFFAGAVTTAIVNNFSWPALTFLVVVSATIGHFLLRHRKLLQSKYEAAEALASVPGPYDKQIYGSKPMLKDLAPYMAAVGVGCLYFAFLASNDDQPTSRLSQIVHHFLGSPGVVAFWALVGSGSLAKASEILIGSRGKK